MYILVKRTVFWHVQIMSRNGQVLLNSETYYSKSNAKRAASTLSKSLRLPVKGV